MDELIPGMYEPVESMPGRYTYLGGSTTGGAVVYDSGKFLYSHHATDPCGGRLVNAFDLVRLHRFGDKDDDAQTGTPANRLPSYRAMCELAVQDKDVAALMSQERYQEALQDFEGVTASNDAEPANWMSKLAVNTQTGLPKATIDNVWIILENDPLLKGKFALNQFAGRGEVLGALPWDDRTERRLWDDNDNQGLYWYMERYVVLEYDESEHIKEVVKVEVLHGGGVDCFIRHDDGTLEPDASAYSGPYTTVTDPKTGEVKGYNWERIPLVCFKSSHHEIPLLSKVKCLQDAYNNILSNFANQMEEDIHTTILVIKNYDGEDLGGFRKNLAAYGAIKVRSYEGSDGGVDTLEINVNAENYKVLLQMLKDAIIENARGYDAKDERMNGNPNQMNIQSMYSDIDLDANALEMEFAASMDELLWFVNAHFANTGKKSYDGTKVKIIFDRDVLINETEVINNCKASVGILSDETIVKMHPWVSDPEQELKRIKDEKEEAMADPYRAAFEQNRNPQQPGTVKDGEDGGQTE